MNMKYILEGNPVALENVIREQRIRIERGQVKVSPASDFTEEVEKVTEKLKEVTSERDNLSEKAKRLESKVSELEKKVQELEASAAFMKAVPAEVTDTKTLDEADSKEASEDSKAIAVDDEKKPKSKK